MFERLIPLIGEKALEKIQNTHILLVGVGGVGGTALEALIRSGIKNITIIDGDFFTLNNLNRQILATKNDLNKSKVDVAIQKMMSINENINIKGINTYLNEDNIKYLKNYDFMIDACDDIKAKLLLIKYAEYKNIPIISALGTGKKLNPDNVVITTLDKTCNDKLAKKLRYEVKKENLNLKIPVCYSNEKAIENSKEISSCIFVPSCAGLKIAHYIIEKVINS